MKKKKAYGVSPDRGNPAAVKKIGPVTLTWLLAACSMIGPFATDMYLPSFHELAAVFGVPLEAVQLTLTAYLVAFSVMTLFYGLISDVIGRRPTMIGGFVLFGLASAGAALSPSLGWLIFFRAVQGTFAGCGLVVGMAVIRDLYGGIEAQRIMAYIAMVFGLGPAMAPIVGGWFASLGLWRCNFILLVAISFLLAAACFILLPESLPKENRTPVDVRRIAGLYLKASRHPPFMVGSFALSIAFLGQGCFIAGAADWCVNVMHLGAGDFWMLFIPMTAGCIAGSWISTWLTRRFGTRNTLSIGLWVMVASAACSVCAIVIVDTPAMPWAVVPLCVYTVAIGIIRPGMSLILLDMLPRSRGLASSLQNFVQTIMFAVTSAAIVPLLYGEADYYEAAMIVFSFLTIALWFASSRMRYSWRSTEKDNELRYVYHDGEGTS